MRALQIVSMLLVGLVSALMAQTNAAAASPTVAYVYVGQNTSPERLRRLRLAAMEQLPS